MHTPLPWNRGYGNYIYQGAHPAPQGQQRLIAVCEPTTQTKEDWDEVFANAALIVRAVNCHAEMLEALKGLTGFFNAMRVTEEGKAYLLAHGVEAGAFEAFDTAVNVIAKAEGKGA